MSRIAAVAASLTVLSLLLTGCGGSKKVAAKVNGDIVTEDEFFERLQDLDAVVLAGAAREGNLQKAGDFLMQQIISEKILLQAAAAKGIKPTEAEIAAYIAFAKKFPGYPGSLPQDPIRTEAEYRREAMIQIAVRELAARPLNLTPQDLQAAYDQVKAGLTEKPKYHLRVIGTATLAKAQAALAALQKGVPFETVALTQSEEPARTRSGDIGFVPDDENVVPKEILQAVHGLKPGEYSKQVIKAMVPPAGASPTSPNVALQPRFYLVKVEEMQAARAPSLDEVRPLVTMLTVSRKDPGASTRVRSYVSEAVAKARIQINMKRYEKVGEKIKNTAASAAGVGQPGAGAPTTR